MEMFRVVLLYGTLLVVATALRDMPVYVWVPFVSAWGIYGTLRLRIYLRDVNREWEDRRRRLL